MKANTDQMAQTRDEKGRITGGTPPAGFNAHPENRNPGGWIKSDTPRFKLEQMMKLSEEDLLEVANDKTVPMFENKLARAIIDGNWTVIKEMTQEVYGKPPQSLDLTTKGESINPISQLTAEELRNLASS